MGGEGGSFSSWTEQCLLTCVLHSVGELSGPSLRGDAPLGIKAGSQVTGNGANYTTVLLPEKER